ncbi:MULTISPECIES: glycerophosphodiester phosphodiesterase [Acinetobacter]|uniref:glycerophosphodiester phosphodiesterase n=1 Tax=Acinetobacter geminorum TaxID=2730922 RepID=A0ABT8ZHF8_9GAMM|nr:MULTISPECIES: glycerophosphodiester phosphodiesterase [Acinetobacter]MCU4360575.1 glycerophosphodiester phosphodiesterase [Acinetobacter sp. WU_MDCI_Abxc22]MDO7363384.1 glycerophosphodiester phosphodiesterase [Acinetobacter geminorum]OTL22026.1 glycerophosphodiester phosphodiesterase [Acinetobacter pittii]
MFKRALLCLSLISLVGCNDDDKTENSPTTPEYQLPKILVVGHRGASALRPEHTLASYQKAIDDGADFIEPDLVSTKDGVLVTRHENEIGGTTNVSTLSQFADRKTTKNIDGKDLTGWFTEDFTLSELQQLKARERIPEFRPANTTYNDLYPVPTLEQVIELAEANYKKTGKIIGLYIETKHPTYFKNRNLAMEDTLLKTLAKYEYTRDIAPVYLQSFEVQNLKDLKRELDLHKTIKHAQIIQLYDAKISQPADFVESGETKTYADLATAQGLKDVAKYANGVGPSKGYILNFNDNGSVQTTSFISDAHAAGLKVHPYTFRPENNFLPTPLKCSQDKPAERCPSGALKEFEAYFKAGVDGVFTDDPALGREAVINFEKAAK